MKNPFDHPHYLAGSVLSRLAVNAATLIWAAIIIGKTDTLVSAGASYAWITEHIPENWVAAPFGAIALTQIIWLCAHWPPIKWRGVPICGVGYGLFAFAWSFVLFNVLLGPRPIQPTSAGWVSVGVALSLFAFVSNARGEDGVGE